MKRINSILPPRRNASAVSPALQTSLPFPQCERGVALVLVLAFLVLITALVIAFFSSVTTELTGAKSYAGEATTKQLADSSVQAVMGAIKQATSSGTTAWASQPGMIRTYDTSGNPASDYKLYSSTNMVVTSFPFNPASDLDTQWNAKPALFTDLNSPVVTSGSAVFPVIDGNNIKNLSVSGSSVYTYSTNGTTQDIAGFWVDPTQVSYTPGNPPSPTNNPVPLPVKWLYVLKDGSLTAPTGVDPTGKIANWTGSTHPPTSANPIVGRVAFWTDDESCKVNINTASEGTYWDVPREACTTFGYPTATADATLGINAPVQKEYQRYPGHPAMTSLSVVFSGTNAGYTSNQWAELLYGIIPRIGTGGSLEGTTPTTKGAAFTAPVPDKDRLFASTDELLFTGSRGLNDPSTNNSIINRQTLEEARFFITASSRSPDVNLFGKPRVCIWPISSTIGSGTSDRTTFDKTIAFCSTMRTDLPNPYLYYFQRQDATDPNIDLPTSSSVSGLGRNRMLLDYLRYLTGQNIPGFGGNFASKYSASNALGGTDRDQILTEIFDYIRSTNLNDQGVTNRYTPGKSNAGSGQVVPIVDSSHGTRGFGRFRTVQGASLLFIANADDVTNPKPPALPAPPDPITGGTTTPVASGNVRVQACFLPQLFDPSVGSIFNYPDFQVVITGLDQFTLGGQPMGFAPTVTLKPKNTSSLDGGFWGDQFGINDLIPTNPGSAHSVCPISNSIELPHGPGGTAGTAVFTGGNVTITLKTNKNPSTTIQTVVLNFPGGTFPLPTVFKNSSDPGRPITDAPVPPAAIGTSSAYVQDYTGGVPSTNPANTYYNMRYFYDEASGGGKTVHGRILSGPNGGSIRSGGSWILSNDVIRSVGVSHGDVRLVAAQQNPPQPGQAGYPFSTIGNYGSNSATVLGTHSWWNAIGRPFYGAAVGHLVYNAKYDNYVGVTVSGTNYYYNSNQIATGATPGGLVNSCNASDIPFNGVSVGGTTANTTGLLPGDWDNGIGYVRDGPFINKADDGDQGSGGNDPYYWKSQNYSFTLSAPQFTPNRLIPSAVMFGSLPTGVFANRPWQTLLFHPDPTGVHPGNKDRAGDGSSSPGMPPDHLLLDLFNMPVVEPYPISEPLSTAGRINMNYQIAPFTYINRDTGIRAVLKAEKVISISQAQATSYKMVPNSGAKPSDIRYAVDMDETMKGFTDRFKTNDIFRSASEICTLPIVPNVPTTPTTYALLNKNSVAGNYWTDPNLTPNGCLTGDNCRERPYATIYPRLTTKSNTYTVHFRVQTLKKTGNSTAAAATWDESKDVVISEYRGSQTIERYVDADDNSLPDFADPAVTTPIDSYYKFRVLATKRFTP